MRKFVVLSRELYQAYPEDWIANSSETLLVEQIRRLPDVIGVRASDLFSLQANILPEEKNLTVIIVDMALRYSNVQEYLREHAMTLIELHKDGGQRRELHGSIGNVDIRSYTLETLVKQIADIGVVKDRFGVPLEIDTVVSTRPVHTKHDESLPLLLATIVGFENDLVQVSYRGMTIDCLLEETAFMYKRGREEEKASSEAASLSSQETFLGTTIKTGTSLCKKKGYNV